MTKLQLPNLHKIFFNTILSINISNTNNLKSFELAYSHARVTSIKSTKQELISQSVSQSVSDKGKQ